MHKKSIAFFMQHYLSISMTFVYRQLKSVSNLFDVEVLVSNKLENVEQFPHDKIHCKKRNFLKFKTSNVYNFLYGGHKLLSISPKLSLQQKKYFEQIIKEKNIKLIHAQFGPSGLEILPIAATLGIPLVVSFHGYDGSFLLRNESYINNLKDLSQFAYLTFPSEYMLNRIVSLGINANRCSVIRCGLSSEQFHFSPIKNIRSKFLKNDVIKFLQVSNFVEKKGHIFTLQAFKKLIKQYPNAYLIFAGDGYLKNEITLLSKEIGLDQHVNFLGKVNQQEVTQLLKDADIFVHHSITTRIGDEEGVPVALMEAMAFGLPVISTYHAGIPELIRNEETGYLVREKDIDSYSNKMFEILSKGDSFRERAKLFVEKNFNLHIETNKLVNIYQNLINEYS